MSKTIATTCSNCRADLTLDLRAGEVRVRIPASGRGSKRVEARTVASEAVFDGALWLWDAPCCEDYADSLEVDS